MIPGDGHLGIFVGQFVYIGKKAGIQQRLLAESAGIYKEPRVFQHFFIAPVEPGLDGCGICKERYDPVHRFSEGGLEIEIIGAQQAIAEVAKLFRYKPRHRVGAGLLQQENVDIHAAPVLQMGQGGLHQNGVRRHDLREGIGIVACGGVIVQPQIAGVLCQKHFFQSRVVFTHDINIHIIVPGNKALMPHAAQSRAAGEIKGDIVLFENVRKGTQHLQLFLLQFLCDLDIVHDLSFPCFVRIFSAWPDKSCNT